MRRRRTTPAPTLWIVASLLLATACSGGGDWQDRAEAAFERTRARAADLADRMRALEDRLAETADSTQARYADELAALDRRRREIEEDMAHAAAAGEQQWRRTSERLEKELEELEERADALREHLDDPF